MDPYAWRAVLVELAVQWSLIRIQLHVGGRLVCHGSGSPLDIKLPTDKDRQLVIDHPDPYNKTHLLDPDDRYVVMIRLGPNEVR